MPNFKRIVLALLLISSGFWLASQFAQTAIASGIIQSAYNLIQDEGSNLTRRTTLNFAGAGVSCADGAGKTTCTVSGASGAAYSQSFTSQTSVVLTHSLGSSNIIVQCFDASTPPVNIEWNTLTVTDTNNATVTFLNAQSGYCVVEAGVAAIGGGAISSKTMSFTFAATDSTIICDATMGSVTGTLPTAVGISGKQYTMKKIDVSANTCIFDGSGAETIDDATTLTISTQYQSYTIISDGTEWWII